MKKILISLISLFILTACQSQVTVKTIDAKEAKKMMENQENLVVDVREKEEYENGHIPNAILIPLSDIDNIKNKIPNKNTTIMLYCQSGKRALEAAEILIDKGYQNVYTFGGISSWPYEVVK